MNFDYVIVGSGLSACVVVRLLAEFKYYNMDQCVLSAIRLADKLIEEDKQND